MAENAQATWGSQMAEMPEAQILGIMAAEHNNALVQFIGIKLLVDRVWPASKALKLKRDYHGQFVGTVAHPISPWHEVMSAVVGAMETHPDDAKVTENACVALSFYFDCMFENGTVSLQEPAATIFSRIINAVVASLGREKAAQRDGPDTRGMMVLLDMCNTNPANALGIADAGGIDVLQAVLLRHQANRKALSKGFMLLSSITRSYPLKLAVSSATFELLRQGIIDRDICAPIMSTMVYITNKPPVWMPETDAAQIREHMKSNITALFPGLCWILAATQVHMKTKSFFVVALLLLTNMAENAVSNEMAGCIIECLGLSVVLDGMQRFRMDYEVQLHGAKAMWALLRFGGVETIEENVKQRVLSMLQTAVTRFDSVDQLEIRTVAKKARELIQLDPIEVDD